jgi:C4-dicarboxylate-specific signal transduction histidine kinase
MGAMRRITDRAKNTAARSATLDLRRRVAALEAEVQEARQLNLRVAELTDLVTELMVPLATRDEERIQATLAKYHEGI